MTEEFSKCRLYNAVVDFVDANVENGLGDKVAFNDPQRSITYAELQARTVLFADGLRSLGLRQESRIALLLHDTIGFPIAFWGAIRAGVVVVPFNTLLTQAQYSYMLADSRVEALVVSAPLADMIAPLVAEAPDLRTVIIEGADASDLPAFKECDVVPFDAFLAGRTPDPFVAPTVSDEVAFWFYTSGSTGHPKGVKHVQTSLMATARLMGQGILNICSDDVVFSAPKLCFAYGLGNALSFPMSVGASAVLWPGRVTAEAVFDMMRHHRPTIFSAVPALYATLLAHDDLGVREGFDRLRLCVSAGEALPAHIGERWREDHRRRHSRRHRIDRDAANLPEQPTGRHPLRFNRQTGAWIRRQDRRTMTARNSAQTKSASWWYADPRPARATGTSVPRPGQPSSANGRTPATNIIATRTAIIISAAAPTICSR